MSLKSESLTNALFDYTEKALAFTNPVAKGITEKYHSVLLFEGIHCVSLTITCAKAALHLFVSKMH